MGITQLWDYVNSVWRDFRGDDQGRAVTVPMAVYLETPGTLGDGEYSPLTLTVDKKLRSDDPTTQAKVDEVIAILEDAGFGNEAIRDLLVTVQVDLDNPAQYRADLTGLAQQATLLIVAGYLDTEITAIINAVGAIPTTPELEASADARFDALIATIEAISAGASVAEVRAEIDAEFTERGATGTRFAYLDNINASLKELFYEHFATTVDDLHGVVATGTCQTPEDLIDNDITEHAKYTSVNQYVDINLGSVAYIKRVRFHWYASSTATNRYKLQAYIAGTWEDCLINIVDGHVTAWGSWLDLTTPRTAVLWRLECTVCDPSYTFVREIELIGVSVG